MKRMWIIAAAIVAVLAVACATELEISTETGEKLDAALTQTMEEYGAPGAVAGLWIEGERVWLAEEGVGNLDTGEEASAEWEWPLRSLTKSATVTVILQLADEGELDLDDPISNYVEDVPNGDRVTLRQLANMSSGVADYTRNMEWIQELVSDPDRRFTLEEINQAGIEQPPDFEPGEDYVYSNTNTNLLGAVIEEVTGQTGEVIQERIIEPLDLESTAYIDDFDEWPEPHASGYEPDESGQPEDALKTGFTGLGPAGAMIASLDDVARWGRALGSGEMVSEDLHEQRLEMNPLSEGPEYDEYGLGMGRIEGWVGHTGEGLGFTALVMHDVETDSTLAAFFNLSSAERHPPTVFFRRAAEILREE